MRSFRNAGPQILWNCSLSITFQARAVWKRETEKKWETDFGKRERDRGGEAVSDVLQEEEGSHFNTLWRCRVLQKNRQATGENKQARNCNICNIWTMERCNIVTLLCLWGFRSEDIQTLRGVWKQSECGFVWSSWVCIFLDTVVPKGNRENVRIGRNINGNARLSLLRRYFTFGK